MRGGSLTRYYPDNPNQDGQGFFGNVARSAASEGWKGLKSGRTPLPNIRAAVRGAKRGATQAVKRKALQEINKQAKRRLNDLFGK